MCHAGLEPFFLAVDLAGAGEALINVGNPSYIVIKRTVGNADVLRPFYLPVYMLAGYHVASQKAVIESPKPNLAYIVNPIHYGHRFVQLIPCT
jgi:hypothetical protein